MTTMTSPATRSRGPWRTARDTFAAYVRLDMTEEAMFPASSAFRYVVLVAPVVTYFFQASFLDARNMYAATLVGVSVAAGLQFALSLSA